MHDLVIVGGGPVGAATAAALEGSGLSILVLEARRDAAEDRRSLALSYGSRLILERIGAWEAALELAPIRTIHVSQQGHFGRALLRADDAGLPALGYVVPYATLHAALARRLDGLRVVRLDGARVTGIEGGMASAHVRYQWDGEAIEVESQLVAVADGGPLAQQAAQYTARDYRQSALVASVTTDQAHHNRAFERFTPSGPVALLPLAKGFALVWTTAPEQAQQLCSLDEAWFLERLQAHFGGRAGLFVSVQERAVYPLVLRFSRSASMARVLLLGNAAQTLHPVAGQGLNLGLRDAFELAHQLRAERDALLDSSFAERFYRGRRQDRTASILLTDALVRVFSNTLPGLGWLRGCGLTALDSLPPAKRALMNRMMFGS